MKVPVYLFSFFMLFIVVGCVRVNLLANELRPPISKSKKFIVSQGFFGKKTHQDKINAYAVDLVMPAGEPVCSVKAGRVHSWRDYDEKPDSRNKRANYVRILHADGSVGDYQHLKSGSISVQTGQEIKQGECFAQVGSTGISTGPHLHFALLVNSGGQFVSVPFKFIDPQGRLYTPEYLDWVRN